MHRGRLNLCIVQSDTDVDGALRLAVPPFFLIDEVDEVVDWDGESLVSTFILALVDCCVFW